jgi:hypothetical protein
VTDTHDYIRQKQNEIWLAKPIEERMRLGLELIQEVNEQTEDRIRTQNPKFTEGEVRAEFIRQMYKNDLSPEYLEAVTQWVIEKYRQRKNP